MVKIGGATLEEVSPYFHLPIEVAAKQLGVCSSALKRRCRRLGIKRWPFRKVRSMTMSLSRSMVAMVNPNDTSIQSYLPPEAASRLAAQVAAKRLIPNGGNQCKNQAEPSSSARNQHAHEIRTPSQMQSKSAAAAAAAGAAGVPSAAAPPVGTSTSLLESRTANSMNSTTARLKSLFSGQMQSRKVIEEASMNSTVSFLQTNQRETTIQKFMDQQKNVNLNSKISAIDCNMEPTRAHASASQFSNMMSEVPVPEPASNHKRFPLAPGSIPPGSQSMVSSFLSTSVVHHSTILSTAYIASSRFPPKSSTNPSETPIHHSNPSPQWRADTPPDPSWSTFNFHNKVKASSKAEGLNGVISPLAPNEVSLFYCPSFLASPSSKLLHFPFSRSEKERREKEEEKEEEEEEEEEDDFLKLFTSQMAPPCLSYFPVGCIRSSVNRDAKVEVFSSANYPTNEKKENETMDARVSIHRHQNSSNQLLLINDLEVKGGRNVESNKMEYAFEINSGESTATRYVQKSKLDASSKWCLNTAANSAAPDSDFIVCDSRDISAQNNQHFPAQMDANGNLDVRPKFSFPKIDLPQDPFACMDEVSSTCGDCPLDFLFDSPSPNSQLMTENDALPSPFMDAFRVCFDGRGMFMKLEAEDPSACPTIYDLIDCKDSEVFNQISCLIKNE